MARGNKERTIRALLDASNDVILEQGAGRLTLDAVAGRTGISKSAILYHFRTRDELARRICEQAIVHFDALLAALQGDDRTPGAYLRAYCKAVLNDDDPVSARVVSLIGSLNRDPGVADLITINIARWAEAIKEDGIDPVRANFVQLAADGLWLHESLNGPPMQPEHRQQLLSMMLDMAQP